MKRTSKSTEVQWLQWIEVQKTFTKTWRHGDFKRALAQINEFLASDPPSDLWREALGYRAWVYRDLKDSEAAEQDLRAALALAENEAGYVTCEILDSLGFICHRHGKLEEAEAWYLKALRTAAADPRAAGGSLLLRLLELRGQKGFNKRERSLVEKVIRQSWHLLRMDGEPDLSDLTSTAQKLIEATAGSFSADRPPAPKAF